MRWRSHPTKRTRGTLLWMLSTKMLPPVGVLVPIYLLFRTAGLLDTQSGLVMIYALMNLPIVVWMLFTFYKEVPNEILEAGRMDGARTWSEVWFLLLPLTMPGVASTGLLSLILCWNEAFWSLNLTSAGAAPLTAFIASFSSPQGLFFAKLSAASTMAVAPILVFGWFSQRQLVQGLTFGRREVGSTYMATLTLHDLRKSYGSTEVIKGIDLAIADREFVVFVGPSGCGKSTLLRMIAGLEEITSGELQIDGKLVNQVGPADRGLAMVFQTYALYPHMTVRQNMGFALRLARVPKAERTRKVDDAARILQLEPYLDRRPKDLSGGQRQRVAIGRAIVRQPKVVPVRRAAVEPGCRAARPDADRVVASAPGTQRHHDLRHPRPDRGDDDGRQDRRAAGRPGRAGGIAARTLSSAGQPVRGRLHRLAA